MARFYVNKNAQENGDHEVHKSDCSFLPSEENRLFLGSFDNCTDAVNEAKKTDPKSNGCYFCSKECHTS
jgi:hypothetical protein